MKKFISMILILTMIVSTVNISFAAELNYGDMTSYRASAAEGVIKTDILPEQDSMVLLDCAVDAENSYAPGKFQLLGSSSKDFVPMHPLTASTDFTYNANLLTSFNTVTGPTIANGANEPKFSYNSFLEESISDYSGELTLNFKDLVLDGRNGLDLRIGRTYQTVATNFGEKSIAILPNDNGYLQNELVNEYSTYLLDRYNLGIGWGFNFPSVQIETEYLPDKIQNIYYYDEETELYYHSGNGEVYQAYFTSDTTDSNLKGYYNRDIQFNKDDTGYSNGQVTSYYSMTLSDKTKQYFAEDGRLIGIVDRFGNTIKFEHTLQSVTNIVPEGNFRHIDDMWISSESGTGNYDALQTQNENIGSNDGYIMYFRRDNVNDDTYIMSRPIQIKPMQTYKLGMRFKSEPGDDIKIEVIGYDTAYNIEQNKEFWIKNYDAASWVDFTQDFSMISSVRYIQIKICPQYAQGTYIDNVRLDDPKPLISKITDTVGRTVVFSYEGDIASGDLTGGVTLTVTSPDGTTTRVLSYNKETIICSAQYAGHEEHRLYWHLGSSSTEGDDGATVWYTYDGGVTTNENGDKIYPALYFKYNSKIHSETDSWTNKAVLNTVRYKDRMKFYEYETVRKHLGDDGYYDTLRIKKKYDMYAYVPDGSTKSYYKGELGTVNYSYSGAYNGNSFDNETGYPDYTFDDETNLNEQWTVTKTGKTTDTVTFSNCAVVQQTSREGGIIVTSDYTNHSIFKNSPTQIKNTTSQGNSSKNTYILYSYNDWGGIETETKEIEDSIKNNPSLLEKYTTEYQYNDFHYVTNKSYYNNLDSSQVSEINTYNANGLLLSSENAVKEKTYYYYENATYPYLITKTTLYDPMRFHNVMGGDRIVTYTYDTYGLYPVTITELYDGGTANTSYVYDYITGDVSMELFPDESYTEYRYYSDGRIKYIFSPYGQYLDGRLYYLAEQHTYTSNAMCLDYDTEVPTYDAEVVRYLRRFVDEDVYTCYGIDVNYYDAVGNLKVNEKYDFSKTDANGDYLRYFTRYYHDTYDRLIRTVDNEGNEKIYTYDGFDRPLIATDSENNIYSYSYNAVENKVDLLFDGATETTDRHLMTQYFDLYGNVTENVVYPNNSTTSLSETYEYDLNNNVISYTDAKGNKTEYVYDASNRLCETVLPNGVKATAKYSAFNEPSFEKIYASDGKEKSARITYRNEKGDLGMRFFNYDKKTEIANAYTSDAKGRIINIRKGENQKSVIYDEFDHNIIVASGNSEIYRRYDWCGEMSAEITDGVSPEIRYGYDALGNKSEKLQNNLYEMAYTYSTIGNITQNTMPSSRTESYTYTANGNLDTIVSDGKTYDYDYYDTGYVKSINYPGGLKTSYEYDNLNRVTKVVTTRNGTAINTFEYEYDNNGNTTKEIRNGAVTSYTYDNLDRLVSVIYSDGTSVAYEYDAINNRTKETYNNGDVKDYVYNAKYQLIGIKLNGQTTDTFTYNETGAVVTHNNRTYTYDEFDRMSGYSDGTNTYTYRYDANGIRTQKNDKQYVIDINNNVIAETDSTGTIKEEILWGHQPLARKVNGSWYYYIYNAHGDVVGLVNSAGTVVNTYEYTPWGEIRNETETIDNPIKYAGEFYDDELDMIYLRARYYNPQIGIFTSLDIEEGEISNPLDMNRYVYCRNNPIKYVDPSGESVVLTCIIIGAVVGGVAGGFAGAHISKKNTGTVNGTSVAIGVLGGATVGGLLGWGFYGLGASISATGLVSTAPGLYKTLDKGVNFAATALQHMTEKARQVPVQVLVEAIKHGTATPDPRGGSGTMYYIEMYRNNKQYILEVLYDVATNTIQHFKYYRP